MTSDERLDRLTENLEFAISLQRSRDDQIAKLIEEGTNRERHIGRLTEHLERVTGHVELLMERTVQAMDAITRLARIAEIHEDRLDDHEQHLDDLEE